MEKQYLYKRLLILPFIWISIAFVHALIYDLLPGSPEAWLIVDDLDYAWTSDRRYSALVILGCVLKGNLGNSLFMHKPVLDLIKAHLPLSLQLSMSAFGVTYVLGMLQGVGLYKQHRFSQYLQVFFSGYATLPSFLLFTFLFVLSMNMGVQIMAYRFPLAIVFLSIRRIAPLARLMASCLRTEGEKPYIAESRHRGVSSWRIWVFCLLRNALIPVWIKAPKQFCHLLFSACIVVEMLFSIKGYGWLSFIAIKQLDYPLILGCILTQSIIISLGYFLGEVLQLWLSPQIRRGLYD